MDSALIRRLAHEHGQAVMANDADRLMADVISELHRQIPQLASLLSGPLTAARVLSVVVFDDHAGTVIEYAGAQGLVTVKARWEDRGAGRPQIVDASPTCPCTNRLVA
jgi:hypothetical protein